MTESPPPANAEAARAALAAGELHVWWVALDLSAARLSSVTSWLSPDESERAARFRVESARRRFLAARGVLRELLGYYCARPPATLRFAYSPTGRPSLVDAPPTFDFNLSHTDGAALYALSVTGRVGVDVERIRRETGTLDAIRDCLADEERAGLAGASEERHAGELFASWTCKEALLKASGWGLNVDPKQIVVRFAADGTVRFLCRDPRLAGHGWTARRLESRAGYAAAVCSSTSSGPVRLRTWDGTP